jgi:hypothetical protein
MNHLLFFPLLAKHANNIMFGGSLDIMDAHSQKKTLEKKTEN